MFLKTTKTISKNNSIQRNISKRPVLRFPTETYFISEYNKYAKINGPVINISWLYEKAAAKSRRANETNILVIPQPGHLIPVNSYNRHGILIPVHRTNTRYVRAIPSIIRYFITVFFNRSSYPELSCFNGFIE